MPAPPVVECPSVAALTAFDLGTLADSELDSVAGHLDDCAACRQALAVLLPPPDPLIVGIRRYVGRAASPSDVRATVDFPAAPVHAADDATVARLPPADVPDGILSPPLEPGEIGRLATYRVLRVLGRGGMGLVFEAEDTQLRRPVALKVMLPRGASDPRNRERFVREARSAAALAHDNIVPVFQVGEDRSVLFIAMPLLKGESLQARLAREAPLPLPDVLRIGREAAAGLAAAHARGLIHRDIKPDNLWLEATDDSPFRVKILDFGLTRGSADDAGLTNPGGVIGTPAYMAPEQARGADVDERADLFSLGCVLYRAATGRPAFRGPDVPALLHAVCYDDPQPPHATDARIPLTLSDLIMRLLSKSASARPSARETLAALSAMEPFLAGPVSAGSESWLPSEPVRAKRRPRTLSTVALFGLLGLIAVGGVVVIEIINRDGTKTTVKMPSGSTLDIDKEGNMKLTLPAAVPQVPVEVKPPVTPPTVIPPVVPPVAELNPLPLAPMPRAAFRAKPRWALCPVDPVPDAMNDLAIGWDGTIVALSTKRAGDEYPVLKWDAFRWKRYEIGNSPARGSRIAVDHEGNVWDLNSAREVWSQNVCRWTRQTPGELAFDIAFAPDGRGFVLGGSRDADEWPVLTLKIDPALDDHRRAVWVRNPKYDLRGVRIAYAQRKDGGALVTLRASGDVYYGTTLLSGQKASDITTDGTGAIFVLGPQANADGEYPAFRYAGDYKAEHRWDAVPGRVGLRITGSHKSGFWLLSARGRVLPPG